MLLDNFDIQILGIYSSWIEAKPEIERDQPDLLIIDKSLGELDISLNLIREQNDLMIPIIVCSEYPDAHHMDLCLKAGVIGFFPPSSDISALTFQIKKLTISLKQEKEQKGYIAVREKRKLFRVPYSKICKIEIVGNYSYLYLVSNKKFALKLSLKRLIEQLDSDLFVRCHRSTLINKDYLESIDLLSNKLRLTNNMTVDIGKSYKKNLKQAFFKK